MQINLPDLETKIWFNNLLYGEVDNSDTFFFLNLLKEIRDVIYIFQLFFLSNCEINDYGEMKHLFYTRLQLVFSRLFCKLMAVNLSYNPNGWRKKKMITIQIQGINI